MLRKILLSWLIVTLVMAFIIGATSDNRTAAIGADGVERVCPDSNQSVIMLPIEDGKCVKMIVDDPSPF